MCGRPVRLLLICVAVSLNLVLAGCTPSVNKAGGTSQTHPVVLTMVNPGSADEVQPFVAAVERLSKGALRIELDNNWHGGQARAEADLVRYVQAGHGWLGVAPVRVWNGLGIRAFDALIAPFAVDGLALERRVLESDVADTMLRGIAGAGLTGIGILPGPIRRPVGLNRRLLGPEDYRGSTLAISASVVATRTFRALHATAVPYLFAGRSVDAFDGVEQQLGSVDGNRYDRPGSTVTANVNLWPRPLVIFANATSFASLAGPQRAALAAAAKAAISPTAQLDEEKESIGNLCRRKTLRFITASPAQLAQLRQATQPVLTWLRSDPRTSRALDQIDSIRAQLTASGADPAPPFCADLSVPSEQGAPTTGHPTTLDGVYEMTTTHDDMVAVGTAPDDTTPENYGNWVFVVDRGLFAFTQENTRACTWGYGRWTTERNTLQWRMIDGGGHAPTPAANKPGEYFVYGWSLYRDTLKLTPVAGEISPENFWAKPWQRVSRTPSRGRLSPRCPPPAQALPAT